MCEEDQLAVLESLRTDTGFALDPDAHALGEARVFGELDLQGQPETIVSTAVGSISVSEAEICLATVGYFLNGD